MILKDCYVFGFSDGGETHLWTGIVIQTKIQVRISVRRKSATSLLVLCWSCPVFVDGAHAAELSGMYSGIFYHLVAH